MGHDDEEFGEAHVSEGHHTGERHGPEATRRSHRRSNAGGVPHREDVVDGPRPTRPRRELAEVAESSGEESACGEEVENDCEAVGNGPTGPGTEEAASAASITAVPKVVEIVELLILAERLPDGGRERVVVFDHDATAPCHGEALVEEAAHEDFGSGRPRRHSIVEISISDRSLRSHVGAPRPQRRALPQVPPPRTTNRIGTGAVSTGGGDDPLHDGEQERDRQPQHEGPTAGIDEHGSHFMSSLQALLLFRCSRVGETTGADSVVRHHGEWREHHP